MSENGRDTEAVGRAPQTGGDEPDLFGVAAALNPRTVSPEPDAGEVRLYGEITRLVFASEDGSFSVIRVADAKGSEETVVGSFGGAFVGQGIEVWGKWEKHPEHGRRLRATRFKFTLPVTADGIRRYLASGLIPGIGPKKAEQIVARFGDKTLDVLDNYSARLTEIPGFGKKTLELVRKAWREHADRREVAVFFQGLGISLAYCNRIYRQFGNEALSVVRNDPYRLAAEVDGIGFLKADVFAKSLGIGHDDAKRLRAGVSYSLSQLQQAGHVCYPLEDFLKYAADLLKVGLEEAKRGLDLACEAGWAAVDAVEMEPGAPRVELVYDASMLAAERELSVLLPRLSLAPVHKGARMDDKPTGGRVSFNAEQLAAVDNARRSPLSVITGGPGVGKTTVVGEIVRRAQAAHLRVYLAAPTGRAAKRLGESTSRHATTIHRLLKWEPAKRAFVYNQFRKLPADLLVVDEISMLDIQLALSLFRAIPVGATVVLVGDADQLPSVGPGDVLNCVIASGVCPVTRLATIYRQDKASRIIPNAHSVNKGFMPDLEPVAKDRLGDFYWIEQDDPGKVSDDIVKMVTERIPKRFGLNPFDDIQVLTPMNRGPCGTMSLNEALQRAVNHGPKPQFSHGGRVFKSGDKVMQTANNYDKGVYNGDIGKIFNIDQKERRFTVRFDIGLVEYDFTEADELVLAYAVTIHKSQGSEFPAVVAPLLTSHYIMLRRNLLYTAMTRAKRLLILIGSRRAVGMAVRNAQAETRHTALARRIRANMGEGLPRRGQR